MSISGGLKKIAKGSIDRFPVVGATYRYIRDNRQSRRHPTITPLGFKLVGNSAMEQGTFEPDETALVQRMLGEVDVFINVGANIGYYCSIALQDGKPTVAFEPMENNLRYLYKNLKANHWDKTVEVFPLALSDRVGITDMFGGSTGASLVPGWAGTPTNYVTSVATSTLDTVLGCRFRGKQCFVLVDVEGAERRMLAGATSFLRQSPMPIWMIEIAVSENQPHGHKVNPYLMSTFEIMWANGYEAFTASRTPRVVTPSEMEAVMTTGRDSLETHNILFIAQGRQIPFLASR